MFNITNLAVRQRHQAAGARSCSSARKHIPSSAADTMLCPVNADVLGLVGEASGEFGTFLFEILALASPTNPKTSALTGHSIVSAALDGMCFRALEQLRA